MCAAHRTVVLSDIKNLLKEKSATVRLVSTQLIEAGVDVDFPVVFRALSGMDSIAQAAGRCNREGKDDKGFPSIKLKLKYYQERKYRYWPIWLQEKSKELNHRE